MQLTWLSIMSVLSAHSSGGWARLSYLSGAELFWNWGADGSASETCIQEDIFGSQHIPCTGAIDICDVRSTLELLSCKSQHVKQNLLWRVGINFALRLACIMSKDEYEAIRAVPRRWLFTSQIQSSETNATVNWSGLELSRPGALIQCRTGAFVIRLAIETAEQDHPHRAKRNNPGMLMQLQAPSYPTVKILGGVAPMVSSSRLNVISKPLFRLDQADTSSPNICPTKWIFRRHSPGSAWWLFRNSRRKICRMASATANCDEK
jgi:hypothetical protein